MRFADLLSAWQVPRGRILYVQSSADWIQRAGFEPAAVLQTLREWVTPGGTLVMPAYPYKTTQLEYLQGHPTFDVRRTPAAVGLLAETFRRSAGVVRSLDPDFSIAAEGVDAGAITSVHGDDPDPFGPESVYARLLPRAPLLLGLGVSLNTNSFVHVIDSHFAPEYPFPVYHPGVLQADVIDYTGAVRTVPRLALRPELQQQIKPSLAAAELGSDPDAFTLTTINGAHFFRFDLGRFERWSTGHARARLADGQLPCWLSEVRA